MITDPGIEQYAAAHTSGPGEFLAEVAAVTEDRLEDRAGMMVGVIEGGLLAALVAISRPRLVVEIGTFTGYSALSMAPALPPGGRIVTCELDEEHAAIARDHVQRSGHADRVEVRVGPALATVEAIDEPIDMAFVDADKTGYPDYVDALLPRLSRHGFVVLDNVLWSGRVADEPGPDDDEDTVALRELNARLVAADDLEVVLLPVRDGISIVRRRS